jgi:hypothetical protein
MEDPVAFPMGAPTDVLTDLRRAVGHAWRGSDAAPEDYFAFEFEFEEAVLVAEAEPQFDQLILHVEDTPGKLLCNHVPAEDYLQVNMSFMPWWPDISGTSAGWRWVLKNQQGYQDGAQLEFLRDGVERAVLQIVTSASSVHVHLVTQVG